MASARAWTRPRFSPGEVVALPSQPYLHAGSRGCGFPEELNPAQMLTQTFKKLVPYGAKLKLREWVLTQYRIPYSRFDVPAPLVARFRGRPPITLIDIGASNGIFCGELDKFVGVRRGLLVEPIPARCEELRDRFPAGAFEIACAAVGSEESSLEMEILNSDTSSSLLPVDRTNGNVSAMIDLTVRERIRTRVARLDALCEERHFRDEVDLLKIDVQGAEHLVLAGAPETLKRTRAIWVEVSFRTFYRGGVLFGEVYELCRAAGFRLANMAEGFRGQDGELIQSDALFVR